jgi:hypothetical protein
MRTYDASYGVDAAELEQAAAETVKRYLLPTPAQAEAPLPIRLRA